jgi:hypothetical protein
LVEAPIERCRIVGPERPDGLHSLYQALPALDPWDAKAFQFDRAVATADAEEEPAAAHHVEKRCRLRGDDGMGVRKQVDRVPR